MLCPQLCPPPPLLWIVQYQISVRCTSHLPLCLSQSSTCNSSTNNYYVSQNHNRCQKLFLWCCLMLSFCSGLSFTIPCIRLHNFNDTEQEQKEKEIWFRQQNPDLYTDKTQLPPPTSLASGLKCKLPASPPPLGIMYRGYASSSVSWFVTSPSISLHVVIHNQCN